VQFLSNRLLTAEALVQVQGSQCDVVVGTVTLGEISLTAHRVSPTIYYSTTVLAGDFIAGPLRVAELRYPVSSQSLLTYSRS
jgi:hypothetical protein